MPDTPGKVGQYAATPVQRVAAVAAWAGFDRGDELVTATAIAMAESGGDPNAGKGRTADRDKPRRGCGSYGLWQINSCPDHGSGAPRYGDAPETLLDPFTNARSALTISGGGKSWTPWSAYKDGSYRAHLDEARKAAAWLETTAGKAVYQDIALHNFPNLAGPAELLGKAADVAGAPLDAARSVVELLSKLVAFLTSWATWRGVLFVLLGLVLIVAAVALFAADLSPARLITQE